MGDSWVECGVWNVASGYGMREVRPDGEGGWSGAGDILWSWFFVYPEINVKFNPTLCDIVFVTTTLFYSDNIYGPIALQEPDPLSSERHDV
ncbi:hypothetical protein NDU88_004409 [Pleurodeles waltl]|uniref:Uncharacterized protein n=1 Tax=Pleurodeles waltl TaxID=8319 RepID=A0AAV7QHQ7_PLEWA|nr:hypothetical protein NDU88_004409 [Pleurodeles waltl]